MKKLPGYTGLVSLILQFVIGGFTAALMFEHQECLSGFLLITAMLIVLIFKLAEWLGKE